MSIPGGQRGHRGTACTGAKSARTWNRGKSHNRGTARTGAKSTGTRNRGKSHTRGTALPHFLPGTILSPFEPLGDLAVLCSSPALHKGWKKTTRTLSNPSQKWEKEGGES